MSGEQDGADKTHEPTRHRLEEARRRGDVPRSADVTAVAALAGLTLAIGAGGVWIVGAAGSRLRSFVEMPDALAAAAFSGGGAVPVRGLAAATGLLLLPVAVAALLVVVALAAQRAVVIAPGKLLPKLDRISPVAGLRNRFGVSGLVGFLRSAAKLVAVSAAAGAFLAGDLDRLVLSAQLAPGPGMAYLTGLLIRFLWLAIVVTGAIAALDLLWQRFDHERKLRMSREDLRQEQKQTEGDPAMKQERRRRGQEIATQRMLQDVPDADVVVVNPQHYAVALKWDRRPGSAPVCVAKGVDEIAARIREIAEASGVPVHRDPPTARALHASVEIGEEIRPEHYVAVAAAIRYAERMRALARARGFGR